MKLSILILVLFISPQIYSQIETDSTRFNQHSSSNNPKYSATMCNLGTMSVRNTYLSPIAQSGFAVSITTIRSEYAKWGIKESNINTSLLLSDFISYQLSLGRSWNKLIYTKNNKLFLYAGGGYDIGLTYESRINSIGYNALSYMLNLQISPIAMIKYRATLLKQHFDITQQFKSPFIGVAILPKYGSQQYNPIGELNKNQNRQLGATVTSPINCIGLSSQTFIDWRRRKKGIECNTFYRLGLIYNGNKINYNATEHQLGETYFVMGIVKKF